MLYNTTTEQWNVSLGKVKKKVKIYLSTVMPKNSAISELEPIRNILQIVMLKLNCKRI